MGWGNWAPYVSVAERRMQADKAVQKAKKSGKDFAPVVLDSRTIARTFWGKAWCDNLEAYSDYESRLPRGRSYVRSGCVIDLQITPGKIRAQVLGSSLYQIEIGIAALERTQWKQLVADCTGSIATLVELLQGRFSTAVMARMCEPKSGLFPSPEAIKLNCPCPDWAQMCKHVAAVLYGVGARLDKQPELLFVLRQVDANDLLATQACELPAKAKKPAKAKLLDDAGLADIFGIEIAAVQEPAATPAKTRRSKTAATAPDAPKTTARKAAARVATKQAKPTAATLAPAPEVKKRTKKPAALRAMKA